MLNKSRINGAYNKFDPIWSKNNKVSSYLHSPVFFQSIYFNLNKNHINGAHTKYDESRPKNYQIIIYPPPPNQIKFFH